MEFKNCPIMCIQTVYSLKKCYSQHVLQFIVLGSRKCHLGHRELFVLGTSKAVIDSLLCLATKFCLCLLLMFFMCDLSTFSSIVAMSICHMLCTSTYVCLNDHCLYTSSFSHLHKNAHLYFLLII